MKSFFIKLGKTWSILRNDGFLEGTKSIFGFFYKFIQTIVTNPAGDVLIITSGVGDSALYRAWNHAEELNYHKIKSHVMLWDNPFIFRYIKRFKIFILHRPIPNKKVFEFIKRAKLDKKEIIFETDDLIFNPEIFEKTESFKKMPALHKKQYEKSAEEILKDSYIKACTTTTTYLKKELEKYHKKVFLVRNKINDQEAQWAGDILLHEEKLKNGKVRLGYFSGTHSHNKDFASIKSALETIMEKHQNVLLYLAGPLDIDDKLNKFGKRIKKLPRVSRKKYYDNIYKIDINLAPIEIGNPFCEAKSELKFFEAGILEIPTVATNNGTFSSAITDGQNGFLVRSQEEWIEKLGQLIENKQLRKEMGSKARHKVLRDYTTQNSHEEEYYDYLRSKLKNN